MSAVGRPSFKRLGGSLVAGVVVGGSEAAGRRRGGIGTGICCGLMIITIYNYVQVQRLKLTKNVIHVEAYLCEPHNPAEWTVVYKNPTPPLSVVAGNGRHQEINGPGAGDMRPRPAPPPTVGAGGQSGGRRRHQRLTVPPAGFPPAPRGAGWGGRRSQVGPDSM